MPNHGKYPDELRERAVRMVLEHGHEYGFQSEALEATGFTLSDAFQTTAYLTDMDHFPAFDAVCKDLFGEHRPARATVRADLVRPEFLVEIQAIAARD